MGAQHDVIMRAYHVRTANALVNLIHLNTASELHLDEPWRKRSMSGATCVMERSYQCQRPTPTCFRDSDAA